MNKNYCPCPLEKLHFNGQVEMIVNWLGSTCFQNLKQQLLLRRKAAESFQGRQDKSWTGITVPMYVVSLTPTSLPLACAQAVSS